MGINIKTPGVHHVTLRVADFRRAKKFYAETLGFPIALEQPDLLIILAGNTAVGLRAPASGTPKSDLFNPLRVGLDHLAIACQDEAELNRVAKASAFAMLLVESLDDLHRAEHFARHRSYIRDAALISGGNRAYAAAEEENGAEQHGDA